MINYKNRLNILQSNQSVLLRDQDDSEVVSRLVSFKKDDPDRERYLDQLFSTLLLKSKSYEKIYLIGCELLKAELGSDAEIFAVESIRAQPGYRKAYELLAHALTKQGDHKEAAVCMDFKVTERLIRKYFSSEATFINSLNNDSIGFNRWVAHPSSVKQLSPPKQIAPQNTDKLNSLEIRATEAYTVSIAHGRLWYDGHNIVVWDRNGRLVEDLCNGNSEIVNAIIGDRQPMYIQGKASLLGSRGTANYYHWMNDALPRLEVLKSSGVELESIEKFVALPLKKRFHEQTLSSFGIDESRLHDCIVDCYIEAKELLIPIFGNELGKKQGCWLPQFLKAQYSQLSSCDSPHKRIYISRGSKGARGIINEEELVEYLLRKNFHILKLENCSLEEQISLFSAADVVFGPHGAGFTNTVFCSPGTKVIELYSSHVEPCFWISSELNDLEHYMHFCGKGFNSTNMNQRKVVAQRLSSLQVDMREIESLLVYAGVV